jgi:microsomal dipeptidase-like Zn-dependent dipeptidase/gamma-glutamyl-gamma-aminobutyrate hydrolase PuuD
MMQRFNIDNHLATTYKRFPEAGWRPVIGITGNYGEQQCRLADGYYKQVLRAGGTPIILPPLADAETIVNTLSHIDGLLLSGGADINPLFCGEEPSPRLGGINSERDLPELLTVRLAFNRQLPILGICRGIQTLAVALGGKVAQDIAGEQHVASGATLVKHSQDADRNEPTHTIEVEPDSILFDLYKEECLAVNSFHHQAVSEGGPHLRVVAQARDGIVEAIESSEVKPILGVQWHPECMGDDGLPLFQWLVQEARHFREASQLHDRVLTLDTHCDTPMFFPQGIDFGTRDPRILVDLHKMTEGRLDATIMVAYLPQPKIGETFSSKVAFDVRGPKEYADLIFDKIEKIVDGKQQYIALARTPGDLYENKRRGRKSIMLGIENGLALNGQLQNVQHFAERGVVYITLCHNGDNDLCDSAKGCNTHQGVSRFGEQVIREMNRLGLMVDLSHASEKSFYDALEISRTPIVCSHSSCRALCDHPRNLTDEQMQALARKGGVCQITLYPGFLRTPSSQPKGQASSGRVTVSQATIYDALLHLEHAIEVMGIDHVGLGTDFDGDGGVPGLANASELILFTRQLLARRYSERDIQKIWGGNFLRVMAQVQRMRE